MHIIFGNVTFWQVPIMKLFNYLNIETFYIFIEAKSLFYKNKIATKLKESNISPLPIEFEKKTLPHSSNNVSANALMARDSDEFSYKKNIRLVSDKILKKYCNLFSIETVKIKKLRLLIQDVISLQHKQKTGKLRIWAALNPTKKIFYVSFNIKCFYGTDTPKNVSKIIIPIPADTLNYFIIILKKAFLLLFKLTKINKKKESETLNKSYFNDVEKKKVAFATHNGLSYGPLFEKTLYYSEDKNSCLHKNNILHLDYSNVPSPEKNIYWVSLKKVKISYGKIFLKTFYACIKTFYLIRGWQNFLAWLLLMNAYISYAIYHESIKKFKSLKICIIDYDLACPKTLILALEKQNIKTVATQERMITTFSSYYANIMLDTYYTVSEYTAKIIQNSKHHDVKNIIPVGQYRSDYIKLFKKKFIPKEISKAKKNGKKILIVLGYDCVNNWFESPPEACVNWSAQKSFLEDCFKLAQNLNNTYLILRYKYLDWANNKYFENILNKINNCENIMISNNYEEFWYAYKLCSNADLIIAKHTSLADECLANEIPVLFYDYTHNVQKVTLGIPNYFPQELECNNFEELLEKSKLLLFNNSSKLKSKILELNSTIYFLNEKGNVKNKIIDRLENLINEAKFY